MADRGRDDPKQEPVSPAEFTKRMPEGESAGPGAPETEEPTQGRDPDSQGPGGPAPRGLGRDTPPEGD